MGDRSARICIYNYSAQAKNVVLLRSTADAWLLKICAYTNFKTLFHCKILHFWLKKKLGKSKLKKGTNLSFFSIFGKLGPVPDF